MKTKSEVTIEDIINFIKSCIARSNVAIAEAQKGRLNEEEVTKW